MTKLVDIYTKVKDFLVKWWFLASTLIIAILYYLVQRKDGTIKGLQHEIAVQKLGEKLRDLKEVEASDEKKFKQSLDAYNALKRQHPELFNSIKPE